jgi:hypothetical protein
MRLVRAALALALARAVRIAAEMLLNEKRRLTLGANQDTADQVRD